MSLSHADYIRLVMGDYKEKRLNNALSPLLAKSTPASIKKECLNVYRERYDKRDEQVLRGFFGPLKPGKEYLQSIRGFATDNFKPLDNYIKGKTENTEHKNLELLAWLIDFQYRPYGKNISLNDVESSFINQAVNDEEKKERGSVAEDEVLQNEQETSGRLLAKESEEEPVRNKTEDPVSGGVISKYNAEKSKFKRAVVASLILIICAGGIYAIWPSNTVCAYWAGDHYEEVPCNEDPKGRLVIAMDPEKVKRFRKITLQDTITARSIGIVHYIKENNVPQFYTEGGNYPEDLKRNLKVLTRYIYDKHLDKNKAVGIDSSAR